MILTEAITISGVRIAGLSYSLKEGLISSKLTVVMRLVPVLASALGCSELLFLENGMPKGGFARLDLDTCCEHYHATFECVAPELKQEFTIEGDVCDGFSVERTDNNDFRLRFRLHHTANLHGPLTFVELIGTASSIIRLTPKQTVLFRIEDSSAVEDRVQ